MATPGEAFQRGVVAGVYGTAVAGGEFYKAVGMRERGERIVDHFAARQDALAQDVLGGSDASWWAYNAGRMLPPISMMLFPGGPAYKGARILWTTPNNVRRLGTAAAALAGGLRRR